MLEVVVDSHVMAWDVILLSTHTLLLAAGVMIPYVAIVIMQYVGIVRVVTTVATQVTTVATVTTHATMAGVHVRVLVQVLVQVQTHQSMTLSHDFDQILRF